MPVRKTLKRKASRPNTCEIRTQLKVLSFRPKSRTLSFLSLLTIVVATFSRSASLRDSTLRFQLFFRFKTASMADQHSAEGSSTSKDPVECSESTVELNIKTLDSQIYNFCVDKNMPVSLFKEKIANKIGVPVGQQRLIFRGKVLKDDQPLSEYHVENGHTLHLVVRQPAQSQDSQPSAGTGSGETTGSNSNQGNDASAGAPRNRVGQISHSVVLGTFNVGDQGEGGVPDLSRVIGAVLNSFGLGSQTTTNGTGSTQSSMLSNAPGQAPQGNEAEAARGNIGGQYQAGNEAQFGQAFPSLPFQPSPQVMQTPLTGSAIPVPSLHSPIPGSLNTLSEFMNRMELALSQNGNQTNPSTSVGDLPTELPSNARGFPTPEALTIVLRHAQRLLSGHTIAALSHIAGRLEQEGSSTDPNIRGQVQAESIQLGLAMQHLGALFLELGRTILTLRMGQSPAESLVNAGPAVYISSSGPNPIMVQPFPLQTSSLFGGSAVPSNPGNFGPVGIGNVPRHINIHIHAGTSLAPIVSAVGSRASNGDGMQGERVNGTGSADSGSTRVLPMRNVIAAAVPTRPTVVAPSGSAQPGVGVSISQPPPDSVSLSTVIAEVNSRIRNFVDNMRGENQTLAGQFESLAGQNSSVGVGAGNDVRSDQLNSMAVNGVGETSVSLPGCAPEREDQKSHLESHQISGNEDTGGVLSSKNVSTRSVEGSLSCSSGETSLNSKDASDDVPISGDRHDMPQGAQGVPLGLGLGGLQPKRRSKQPKLQVQSGDSGTSSAPPNQDQHTETSRQQILQSLGSRGSILNRSNADEGQGSGGQFDPTNIMSQVIQSPALNGLLAGVSQQTGVGSPDVLRNMLEQFSQSPVMRNAVNQIAQQVDNQDVGNMFSGLGSSQGGGIDLSRMVQQMMPIVSRALGSGSTLQEPFHAMEAELQSQNNDRRQSRDDKPNDHNSQIDLQQVAQMIEHQSPPNDIFQAITENAVRLNGNESDTEDLVEELCGDESLASEFMEILRRDLCRRLEGEPRSAD